MTQKNKKELFSAKMVRRNDGKIITIPFFKFREEMLSLLIAETEKAGKKLTFTEFSQIPTAPKPNEYICHSLAWASFDEAAEEAWQAVKPTTSGSCLTELGKKALDFSQKNPGVRPPGLTPPVKTPWGNLKKKPQEWRPTLAIVSAALGSKPKMPKLP